MTYPGPVTWETLRARWFENRVYASPSEKYDAEVDFEAFVLFQVMPMHILKMKIDDVLRDSMNQFNPIPNWAWKELHAAISEGEDK